jgi:predicted AlkP superfamily phosphohydrolase/phosphomutase
MPRGLSAALVITVAVVAAGACRSEPPSGSTPRDAASPGRVGEIAAQASPGRRVIVVGLDGADWGLLDGYAARGVMPALGRLVKEGTSGTLTTLHPPLSPLIWTTIVTGVSPVQHHILDFLRVNPATGQREPITSDERAVPAIWNMATYAGRKTGSLGLWATYPAEAVNGLMVSDRLFTFLYSEASPPPGVVFPPGREAWAREGLARAEREADYAALKAMLPWLSEAEYREAAATTEPYSHPVSALRRILIETSVYGDLGRDWFAAEQPDLLTVYIQGTDSIGHVFAPYAPPRQPTVAQGDYDRYHDVPERYFARIDRLLDAYRQLAESSGSLLMLVSDHGFKWGEGRPATLSSVNNATAAKWHADEGIYLLWGPGIAAKAGHDAKGSVQQVTATLLALLGLPRGDVAGPPLAGAPPPSGAQADYRKSYTPAAVVAAKGADGAVSKDDAETVAKLRALGYIGGGESTGKAIGTRTAGSFNNEGLLLKNDGRTADAIDAFDKALTVDPNLASALWNLSDLLFAGGQQLDKSDTLLVRAFVHGLPEGSRFLIGRAIGYQRDGKIDRSLKLLNDAAAAKPDDPEVLLFRGRYRVEAGNCGAALEDFRRATELAPANPAGFASRGLAELCAGDRAAARRSFQKSLELDPNQPKVREYLRSMS